MVPLPRRILAVFVMGILMLAFSSISTAAEEAAALVSSNLEPKQPGRLTRIFDFLNLYSSVITAFAAVFATVAAALLCYIARHQRKISQELLKIEGQNTRRENEVAKQRFPDPVQIASRVVNGRLELILENPTDTPCYIYTLTATGDWWGGAMLMPPLSINGKSEGHFTLRLEERRSNPGRGIVIVGYMGFGAFKQHSYHIWNIPNTRRRHRFIVSEMDDIPSA